MTAQQVDVFVGGTDNVNTYRIPSLIVAPGGTLLAFSEARKQRRNDASPTDMVLKRSTDGGRTWGPKQIVIAGQGDEAIMNPCPVVVGKSVLLFCMNAHKTDRGHHRHLLVRSDDEGATWSEPRDVTDAVGDDTFIPGPGVSIRMRTGRIVVPGYSAEFAEDGTRIASYSRVAFSDDEGQSWRLGEHVGYAMSNESQVVELGDGSLMFNWRIQKYEPDCPGCRGVSISTDGGATWGEPAMAEALNDVHCQSGFVRWVAPDGHAILLFSNPDAKIGPDCKQRTRMTVRLSTDEGCTWPAARLVHAGMSAYSCPAVLPDGTIALIYEYGEEALYERLRVALFTRDWLEAGVIA